MKRTLFFVCLLSIILNINGQNENYIFKEADYFFHYSKVPTDSIITKQFSVLDDDKASKPSFVKTHYAYFHENGLMCKYEEKDSENKKTRMAFAFTNVLETSQLGVKINKLAYYFFKFKGTPCVEYKFENEDGNIENWKIVKYLGDYEVKDYGKIKIVRDGRNIATDYQSKDEGKIQQNRTYDDTGKIIKQNASGTGVVGPNTFGRSTKFIYNSTSFLIKEMKEFYEIDSKTKVKSITETSSLFYEYPKLDAKGNWTECIIKDKGDNVIEKYTRQIFYPK